MDDRKEEPYDFALWKSAKPGEPYWESPWGREAGMAYRVFGDVDEVPGTTLDIHGGGADLVFLTTKMKLPSRRPTVDSLCALLAAQRFYHR